MWATERAKELLRLRRKGMPLRCPYCHDDLGTEEAVWCCDHCLTTVHKECYGELNRCPSCTTKRGKVIGKNVGATVSSLPPGVKLVGATCKWCHRCFTDYTGHGLCRKCTKTCECGKPITQKGEFRCYDCWDVDTETAFPSYTFWAYTSIPLAVLIGIIVVFVAIIWMWSKT